MAVRGIFDFRQMEIGDVDAKACSLGQINQVDLFDRQHLLNQWRISRHDLDRNIDFSFLEQAGKFP